MPAPAGACSCSCPWLLEWDPADRGCLGWGGGDRPGTGAFSDATRSGESLHPWQRGSGQAGSPDAFPCRHERAWTPPAPLPLSDPLSSPFPAAVTSAQLQPGQQPPPQSQTQRQRCSPPSFCAKAAAAPPCGAGVSPRAASKGQGRDTITAAKRTRTLETGAIPPSHSC